MGDSRFGRTAFRALGTLCILLLIGSGPADAKAPVRPAGGPKKPPAAAKPSAKPKPAAKPVKAKPPIGKPVAARGPVSRPPLPMKAGPKNHLPASGTVTHRFPPVYLGHLSPRLRPTLVVPRVIQSTSEHVSSVTSTETSQGISVAPAPEGRPDLAVTEIRAEYGDCIDSSDKQLLVSVTLKNLGGAAFHSDEGAQVLVLYKNGELVAQQDFHTLEVGQTLNLTVETRPEPVVYEARVLFADDLRQDGNPSNDDLNPRNDTLSQELDLSRLALTEPQSQPLDTNR